MKSLCLLLSAPILLLAQSYGVPPNETPVGYAPPSAPAYPLSIPVQSEPYHDVLYPGRRHHRKHHWGSKSSSSESSASDNSCNKKLRSKCDRDDDNCKKAKVDDNTVICRGKRGEIVQMQDGKGNLIDYGFGNVEVDVKCRKDRWQLHTFENKRLKVKNVVCYRFPLPAIIDISSFETARSTPFDLSSFLDNKRVSDAIQWSASVFTIDPSAADRKEVQEALLSLDKALTKE